MLGELAGTMGYELRPGRQAAELGELAARLSQLARKEPAWGWRYLRNVLKRKMDPGDRLWDAMVRLAAVMAGTAEEVARSERVEVQAVGKVRAGALILAGSRPCEGCGMEFVPRTPRQRFHSAGCRTGFYRRRKAGKPGGEGV